jgi:hypothetical protein
MFDNGEPRDACKHDIIDATGANPVCRLCGEVFTPDEDDAEATQ